MNEQMDIGKKYVKEMPILWWTSKFSYIKFISRELTSVFVACYTIILLLYLIAIDQGPESFYKMSLLLKQPIFIVFHAVAFISLVFHSITWFNLAPQAMVIKIGNNKIPGLVIALLNYIGWGIISIGLFIIILNS